jgi:hypothetical protein
VFVLRRRKLLQVAQGFCCVASTFVELRSASAADGADTRGQAAAQVDEDPFLGVDLTYDAPSGCGDEREVLRRTQQLLAGPIQRRATKAAVVVRLVDGGLKLTYEATTDGAPSRRDLVVTDCAAAVEASALLLMLTLDPMAAARAAALPAEVDAAAPAEPETPATGQSEAGPLPAPPPKLAPPPKPVQPSPTVDVEAADADVVQPPSLSSPFDLGDTWVGVAGELVTGLAPNAGRGLRLDVGTTVSGVRVGVWGSYDWVSPRVIAQAPFASIESRLYRLRVWAGPSFRAGAVQFGPLLAFGAEHLRAEVVGISDPAPGAMTWLSGAVGGHFDVHLTRSLALRAQAAAVFSLERRSFTVRGIPDPVHQPRALGVEGAGGLLWVWGAQ